MTKKIAVINDLSGFGRCSLTAAISVISSMGVQPCPLPTAILTAQTGYPSYVCDDYTEKMDVFRTEWEKMGVSFDGIYTGFLSDSRQADSIFRFLDTFYRDGTFLIVDPVMGDDGEKYDIFTDGLLDKMRELAVRAHIITPNLTELCLLLGEDYHFLKGMEKKQLVRAVSQMGQEMRKRGPKEVVVTGIRYTEEESGVPMMGNLAVTGDGTHFSTYPFIGESYSGTGDLFASVVAGGKARGELLEESMSLAGDFIGRAIKDSVDENVDRNDGVNYEKFLFLLNPK